MTAEWKTSYCRYEETDTPGQVKVTLLDYAVEQTVDEVTGSRVGRRDISGDNRVYALPALEAVPAHVMTGWVKDSLGPELVLALEQDAIPAIDEESDQPPTGGFDPNEES